jgi:HlyD family secretion protein
MTVQWRRRVVWFLVAVAVVAGLIYGYWPQARPVEVAKVHYGPLRVTIEEEGETRVIDRYLVSAPVPGYAQRIQLKVGAVVGAGQTLVQIEPLRATVLDPRERASAQARVSSAQAALRSAEQRAQAATSEAEQAQRNYDRTRNLAAEHFVSKQAEDEARTALQTALANRRSAEFGVQVARFDLQAARTTLSYSGATQTGRPAEQVTIKAPVAGSVLKVYHESEGPVTSGAPLIEIGNPRSLEVVVDVLSDDAVRIKPGSRVILERWGDAQGLEGRVRLIEPVGFTKISALGVEEQRVNVIADITSAPARWERLGHGYRVEASFVLWEADRVLQVPASALFRVGEDWAVFVVNNGKAHRQIVRVGQRSGLSAQIVSGLSDGETVIAHPDDSIHEGVSIATN